MKSCNKCGYELREGSLFCSNCGISIKEESDIKAFEPNLESQCIEQKIKPWYRKKTIYISISSILLIAILATIFLVNRNPISKELYQDAIALLDAIDDANILDDPKKSIPDETKLIFDGYDDLNANDAIFKIAISNVYLAKFKKDIFSRLYDIYEEESMLTNIMEFDLLYEQGKKVIKKANIGEIKKYNAIYNDTLESINSDIEK